MTLFKSVLTFYVLLVVVCLTGWIADIVHVISVLVNSNPTVSNMTIRFILECVGIVIPPLGVLMGWLHIIF